MPPRVGKSEIVSKWFPAWYLHLFPEHQILLNSYSGELAGGFSGEVRDIIAEYAEEIELSVAKKNNARATWKLSSRAGMRAGGMRARGVRGSMTGTGANLLIIDDPIKDWMDAYSETTREAIRNWYRSTAYTRLEPGGSVVIVMTRWHADDLAGWLLKEATENPLADQWQVINLPALGEPDDPLGRELGAAICPARYTEGDYARIMASVGPLVWQALYCGRPVPLGGHLFPVDAWRFYNFPPSLESFDRVIASWDLAFDDLTSSDFVVGLVLGFKAGQCWVLDLVRGQLDFDATCKELMRMKELWPRIDAIYIEKSANGPAVMQHLRNKVPGILPVVAEGSKQARAAAVQPFSAAHNVLLPRPDLVPWVAGFMAELASFPLGAHDDQVDAYSQGVSRVWLAGGILSTPVVPFTEKPDWRKNIS